MRFEVWYHGPKSSMAVHRSESKIRAKRIASNLTRQSKCLLPPCRYSVRTIAPNKQTRK